MLHRQMHGTCLQLPTCTRPAKALITKRMERKEEKRAEQLKSLGWSGGTLYVLPKITGLRLLLYNFSLSFNNCLVENIPISQNIRARNYRELYLGII